MATGKANLYNHVIALFANDVRRYHEYALGSHPGASRTSYSPKWPLVIRITDRNAVRETCLVLLSSTLNSKNIAPVCRSTAKTVDMS